MHGSSATLMCAMVFAACVGLLTPGPAANAAEASLAGRHRIVAVGGSLTEIVYALGAGDRLAARDSTGTYPPQARQLPDVGYMRQLSPEGVLSVDPDGILAIEGSGPPEAIDVLTHSGLPMVVVPEGYDPAAIVTKIERVGAALDLREPARQLAGQVQADLARVRSRSLDVASRKRVLFVLSAQNGKILAAGRDTAADGIIRLAGAVNAVDAYHGYKALTDEALLKAKPDAVLTMDRGGAEPLDADRLFANAALAATPAGRSRTLIHMDGLYLLGFGPRTAAAAGDLADRLYGKRDKP